jgi:cell division septal protein FtsQ
LAERRLRRGRISHPRLRLGLQVLGVLLAVGLVWLGAPKLLHRLDFFRIRQVEITGLRYLPPAKVIAALQLGSEASVFDNLAAAGDRVRALPGVASAVVVARLPGTLEI